MTRLEVWGKETDPEFAFKELLILSIPDTAAVEQSSLSVSGLEQTPRLHLNRFAYIEKGTTYSLLTEDQKMHTQMQED